MVVLVVATGVVVSDDDVVVIGIDVDVVIPIQGIGMVANNKRIILIMKV